MKIATSVRAAFQNCIEDYNRIGEIVDRGLCAQKEKRWHYESRVKSEVSFAQKLETGRAENPRSMEDLFACTLVVENRSAIKRAEAVVNNLYIVKKRRPKRDDETTKPPETFRFDDLRLYVHLKADETLPSTGVLGGLIFEVQIKTFLQHAWSIATHDLVYKGREVSWPKNRIAYQVKAMLEQAETSIAMVGIAEMVSLLDVSDQRSKELRMIVDGLEKRWGSERLPEDCVRLAKTINKLIKDLGFSVDRLWQAVDKETKNGRGAETLNLSPYGAIVQSLLAVEFDRMAEYLRKKPAGPRQFRVFIPREIELPEGTDRSQFKRIVSVD